MCVLALIRALDASRSNAQVVYGFVVGLIAFV